MAPVIIMDKYKFVVFDPDERINVASLKHYASRAAAEAALRVRKGEAEPPKERKERKPSAKRMAKIEEATASIAAKKASRKEMGLE